MKNSNCERENHYGEQEKYKMEFVIAEEKHIDRMCEITEQAKRQLKNLGLDQWQKGYPSREVWIQDAENKCTYLAEEDGEILGIFAFQTTPDASYHVIDGEWLTDGEYASMHRVCVADECKGKGVAGNMFAKGFEMAKELGLPSMRIDTHPGNLPMQRALKKAGFTPCGEIHLVGGCEDGNLRIAFEKVLK